MNSSNRKSRKPVKIIRHDDVVNHLRRSLARARSFVPKSLADQLCGILNHFLRQTLRGNIEIYPGMAKMATWGRCSTRHARSNFVVLKDAGIVLVTRYPNGGRRASRFTVHSDSIARWLIIAGINPSMELISKLRDLPNPGRIHPINAEQNPEVSSAGIHIYSRDRETVGIVAKLPTPKPAQNKRERPLDACVLTSAENKKIDAAPLCTVIETSSKSFEDFWNAYPDCKRKTGKDNARAVFIAIVTGRHRIIPTTPANYILNGLEGYKDSDIAPEFTMLPTNWLNSQNWKKYLNSDGEYIDPDRARYREIAKRHAR